MDRGAYPSTVPKVTKSWTRLKQLGSHFLTGGKLLHNVMLVSAV